MLPNIQNDQRTAVREPENQCGAPVRPVTLEEFEQMKQKWQELQKKWQELKQKARETQQKAREENQDKDDDSAATTDKSSQQKGNWKF